MAKILEALYDGNLSITPDTEKRSREHQKAIDTAYSLMESLEAKLNHEEKELLDRVTEALSDESGYYATEQFIRGYCLGTLTMLEVMEKRNDLILSPEETT